MIRIMGSPVFNSLDLSKRDTQDDLYTDHQLNDPEPLYGQDTHLYRAGCQNGARTLPSY